MTEHISEQMAKLLVESGWTEAQLEDMTTLAEGRAIKALKQEGIGPGAAGSESGAVLGTDPASSGDYEQMTSELQRLQKLKPTAEIMQKRKALRNQIDAALPPMEVKFTKE